MNALGSISIKFHPSCPPSRTLAILRSAGWQLAEDTVWFQHYAYVEDMPVGFLEAPASDWERVELLLDAKHQAGEFVVVRYEYTDGGSTVLFDFYPQEKDGIQEIVASLEDPRPHLCGTFTDFGWYLPKIIAPLYDAGYNVLEVNCRDDAY